MNKKKITLMAIAICLIAILSMSTLAWFSADETVENKFLFTTSEEDEADKIFSVDVTETTPAGEDTDGYEYVDVLPGDELVKTAKVTNTGYYDQYIRVTIELSDAAVWAGMLGANFTVDTLKECVVGYDPAMWLQQYTTVDVVDGKIKVVLYYNGILDGSDTNNDTATETNTITVFEKIKVSNKLTQAQAAAMADGFTVSVKAEAIQTENLGTAANAYEAFAYVAANA